MSKHNAVIDNGDLFQLTVYSSNFTTPDFIKGGVMYQIFPTGFAKVERNTKMCLRIELSETIGVACPIIVPTRMVMWNNDYFGGDLEGIRSKLPYLAELGITCIYLNPIFEAHENHRYNTADYMKIDPMLGTNEDFKGYAVMLLKWV